MKKFTKLVSGVALGFILAACGNAADNNVADTSTPATNETTAPEQEVPVNDSEIVFVLFPNESGSEFAGMHADLEDLIYRATGRPGRVMTTTDYTVTIQAIAEGSADLAYLGPIGYILASRQNSAVRALMTSSGPSGTLEDAVYYSFLAVREEDAHLWEDGQGGFDLSGLEGASMSFVSPTSTSGFVVPGSVMQNMFDSITDYEMDLIEGGPFFSEVLFGGSHQGSAYNLITGQTDVAAFFNMESFFIHNDGPLNQAGMVYAVRDDAAAPLEDHRGALMRIILSITVPNAPVIVNAEGNGGLTEAEIEAIVELFLSEEVTNNPNFFSHPDDGVASLFTRTDGDERFLRVDPSFYDDLR